MIITPSPYIANLSLPVVFMFSLNSTYFLFNFTNFSYNFMDFSFNCTYFLFIFLSFLDNICEYTLNYITLSTRKGIPPTIQGWRSFLHRHHNRLYKKKHYLLTIENTFKTNWAIPFCKHTPPHWGITNRFYPSGHSYGILTPGDKLKATKYSPSDKLSFLSSVHMYWQDLKTYITSWASVNDSQFTRERMQ